MEGIVDEMEKGGNKRFKGKAQVFSLDAATQGWAKSAARRVINDEEDVQSDEKSPPWASVRANRAVVNAMLESDACKDL